MTIMEERARNLGGQLAIENLPTLGTRVTLHFMPNIRRDGTIPIHPAHLTSSS
jgi:two-component system nitrate/nitrite sensor histidine kinase NarX